MRRLTGSVDVQWARVSNDGRRMVRAVEAGYHNAGWRWRHCKRVLVVRGSPGILPRLRAVDGSCVVGERLLWPEVKYL